MIRLLTLEDHQHCREILKKLTPLNQTMQSYKNNSLSIQQKVNKKKQIFTTIHTNKKQGSNQSKEKNSPPLFQMSSIQFNKKIELKTIDIGRKKQEGSGLRERINSTGYLLPNKLEAIGSGHRASLQKSGDSREIIRLKPSARRIHSPIDKLKQLISQKESSTY